MFFGDPVVVERIVKAQEYNFSAEGVLPIAGGTTRNSRGPVETVNIKINKMCNGPVRVGRP